MYADCDVPAFNAYLGDVELDVHPVQAINENFTLRAISTFWGGCCGGCGSCGGFHARKIRFSLQIPSELTLLTGNNPEELSDVEGLPAGKHTNQEVLWTLVGIAEGKYVITVTVVTENTIPHKKQASYEVSIVRGLVVGKPLIEPVSPTPNDDVTVCVNISNPLNVSLENVTLGYFIQTMTSPIMTLMHREVISDSWYATIPKQPEGSIKFYIEVIETDGNSTRSLEYTYRVQDPIRIETWYRNTVSSVTLSSLIGLFFVALASYSKHRKRKTSLRLGEPAILTEYETVPHHKTASYNDEFTRLKNWRRTLILSACLALGVILLCLAVYFGQLYEWIKFLGG